MLILCKMRSNLLFFFLGKPWVQFICKDGTNSHVLRFESDGYSQFVAHLQNYITLSRSSKEKNLVVVVDPRADALEKSVGMLNIDKDIVSVSFNYKVNFFGF